MGGGGGGGARSGSRVDVNQELKLFENWKKSEVVGWGSGGCEPRSYCKTEKVGIIGVMGIGPGMGRVDVNQEFKFIVKLKNIGGGGCREDVIQELKLL